MGDYEKMAYQGEKNEKNRKDATNYANNRKWYLFVGYKGEILKKRNNSSGGIEKKQRGFFSA